jgi:hypothetical protein
MEFVEEQLRRIAFHEAGHAWMMFKERLGIRSVTVDATSAAPGDTRGLAVSETVLEENNPELSRKFARTALSGSLAEHFLMGQWDVETLQARDYDGESARSALAMSGEEWSSEEMDLTVHSLSSTVLNEISRLAAWDEITIIAYALMENTQLSGPELMELLGE